MSRSSGTSRKSERRSSRRDRDRGYERERERDRDRDRERCRDRGRDYSRDRGREREHGRDRDRDRDHDRERDRDRHRDRTHQKKSSSAPSHRRSRTEKPQPPRPRPPRDFHCHLCGKGHWTVDCDRLLRSPGDYPLLSVKKGCWQCGQQGHLAAQCSVKKYYCNDCGGLHDTKDCAYDHVGEEWYEFYDQRTRHVFYVNSDESQVQWNPPTHELDVIYWYCAACEIMNPGKVSECLLCHAARRVSAPLEEEDEDDTSSVSSSSRSSSGSSDSSNSNSSSGSSSSGEKRNGPGQNGKNRHSRMKGLDLT